MRIMMTTIKVNKSGKGGPACSWAIEPSSGCLNNCIGCYGKKSSRQGKQKYIIEKEKELNDAELIKSIKSSRKKGMAVCRVGKFCDPCSPISSGKTSRILEAASSEGIRCVTISKSIGRTGLLLDHFKPTKHMLHISAGMLCGIKNEERIKTFRWFKNNNANVKLRITDDITVQMSDLYLGFNPEDVIVTPLRFPSSSDSKMYNANLDNYVYDRGYWRPKVMHSSWIPYTNICGTISNQDFCCNCLLDGVE